MYFGPTGLNTTSQFETLRRRYSTASATQNTPSVLHPYIPRVGIPMTFKGPPGGTTNLHCQESPRAISSRRDWSQGCRQTLSTAEIQNGPEVCNRLRYVKIRFLAKTNQVQSIY